MSEQHPEPKSGNKVLIIILVVLAAGCLGCGGIATLIFFGSKSAVEDAMEGVRHALAESQATTLRDHLHALELQGKVPATATAADVARLVREDHPNGHDVLIDPWHNEYVFRREEGVWMVTSTGPDGVLGTEDDIDAIEHEDPDAVGNSLNEER